MLTSDLLYEQLIGIGLSIEEGVSLPKIGHMTYNLIAFFKTFSVLYGLG